MEKENASKGKAKNTMYYLFIYFNLSRDKVC